MNERKPLTPTEDKVYTFILGFADEHNGRLPSDAAICERFGYAYRQGSQFFLRKLRQKGWLDWDVVTYRLLKHDGKLSTGLYLRGMQDEVQ